MPCLLAFVCLFALTTPAAVAKAQPAAKVAPSGLAAVPQRPTRARPAAEAPQTRPHAQVSKLLARVQHTYARRNYTASFSQTYTDSSTGPRATETGTLQVTADGKVRFAYAAPEDKLFVFDGNTAFFAEPSAAQVTRVADFAQGPAGEALAFLWGGGAGLRSFVATACSQNCPQLGQGEQALTFRPKVPMAAVARLDLVVDARRAEVAAVRLCDALHNQTLYRLDRRTFDGVLDANDFVYVPPKDFSVVQALAE